MEKNKTLEKFESVALVLQENVYVQSLSKGMMQTIPVLILGAIITLLNSIQFGPWQSIVSMPGISGVLNALSFSTNGMYAVWVLLAVAYRMGRNFGQDPFATVMSSLVAYLTIIPVVQVDEVGQFINSSWTGTTGVFTAMLVSILISRLYIFLIEKEVFIKMPKEVPDFVERSFANIIPLLIIAFVSGLVLYIFLLTTYESLPSFIYTMLQLPLTKLGGSYIGVSLAMASISLLWWMGIHGKMIVYGAAFGAIFSVNGIENAEAVAATGQGTHAFDIGSVRVFFEHGGAGSILGLIILMVFFAKSEQYKSLGKVFAIPTFFGISEPAIFGTPIVLDLRFLPPMILAPFVSGTIGYIALQVGFLPYPGGIAVPTGTPYFIDAFLIGGVSYLIVQIVGLLAATAVWYPFFR